MPDISMCNGIRYTATEDDERIPYEEYEPIICSDKEKCYRHSAYPNLYKQSWFSAPGTDKTCGYFIDNKDRRNCPIEERDKNIPPPIPTLKWVDGKREEPDKP